jgi:tetratricopeptide (TPR) repeat protein
MPAATFAKTTRRVDEAIRLESFLVDRDPLCIACLFGLGKSYQFAGRLEDAEETFRTLQAILAGGGEWNMGMIKLAKGEPEAALESFGQLDHHEYIRLQGRAMALFDLGRIDDFEGTMAELVEMWGEQAPTTVAGAYAWARRNDDAFAWIDRAIANGRLVDIQTEFPELPFDRIRDDDRWMRVMERIGRAPDQLNDYSFSVRLPE